MDRPLIKRDFDQRYHRIVEMMDRELNDTKKIYDRHMAILKRTGSIPCHKNLPHVAGRLKLAQELRDRIGTAMAWFRCLEHSLVYLILNCVMLWKFFIKNVWPISFSVEQGYAHCCKSFCKNIVSAKSIKNVSEFFWFSASYRMNRKKMSLSLMCCSFGLKAVFKFSRKVYEKLRMLSMAHCFHECVRKSWEMHSFLVCLNKLQRLKEFNPIFTTCY